MLKKKDDKLLFLIAARFPFGNQETFLETEIKYLSQSFTKIIIISHDLNSINRRDLPSNVQVKKVRYELSFLQRIISIRQLLKRTVWMEFRRVKKLYFKKLNLGILKTAIISLENGNKLAKKYFKIKNKTDFKNIFFYSYWCNDSAIALALLSQRCKGVFFSRIHGWDVFFEPSKYDYLPYRSFIHNNLNSIYSVSKEGLNYCVNNWKINNSVKLKLSRLGVNKGKFILNISKKLTIVSCSNMIAIKRIDLLIFSLSLVKFNLEWIHFGDGNEHEKLLSLAKNELPPNIDFEFKGRVNNSKIIEYYKYKTPGLFINLSTTEGIPVSIMEAMSFGIPVIATDVGGTSEIVNDKNGYLLEANPNPKTVAKIITRHYNSSTEQKKAIHKESHKTWYEKFNAANNYESFIENIISLKIE